MNYRLCGSFFLSFLLACLFSFAQDSTAPFKWLISSKRISGSEYELSFSTRSGSGWQLYAPSQLLGDVPSAELQFSDSAIQPVHSFNDSGKVQNFESSIFG